MNPSKRLADFAKLKTDSKRLELHSGESFYLDGDEYEVLGIDYAENGDSQIIARRIEIPFAED